MNSRNIHKRTRHSNPTSTTRTPYVVPKTRLPDPPQKETKKCAIV